VKILLVNPPIYDKFDGIAGIVNYIRIPLGLLYIASMCEKNGHEVKILDITDERIFRNIESEVEKFQPDLVGVSINFTCVYPISLEVILRIKKVYHGIMVVGGLHPSSAPIKTIKNEGIDVVVVGEGEHTMAEIASCIEREKNLKEVKGIIFKKGKKIISNGPRSPVEDLDSLPYPARHLVDWKKYNITFSHFGKQYPVLEMLATRGCLFNCSFCSINNIAKGWRKRDPTKIIDEIEYCFDRYGKKAVEFEDAIFTGNRIFPESICNEILKRGLDFKWLATGRVDVVSKDLINLMSEAGCVKMFFGLESGSQRILNEVVGKNITVEQSKKTLEWCINANIEPLFSFIIGHPTETKEDLKKTINLINFFFKEYGIISHVNIFRFFPNTRAEKISGIDHDWLSKPKVADPFYWNIPVSTGESSLDKLIKIQNEAEELDYMKKFTPMVIFKGIKLAISSRNMCELKRISNKGIKMLKNSINNNSTTTINYE